MEKSFTQLDQFRQGKSVESWLDRYFQGVGFQVQETTPQEERELFLGDRWFTSPSGEIFSVEYKSGIQTKYTGNIFLETISVDTHHRRGWVYTCQATFIFYACLLNGIILIFKPPFLRDRIEQLRSRFREVHTCHGQNQGYTTHGLIVPLEYARAELAQGIINIVQKGNNTDESN